MAPVWTRQGEAPRRGRLQAWVKKWLTAGALGGAVAVGACQYNGVVDCAEGCTVTLRTDETVQDRGRQQTDVAREAEVGITEGL